MKMKMALLSLFAILMMTISASAQSRYHRHHKRHGHKKVMVMHHRGRHFDRNHRIAHYHGRRGRTVCYNTHRNMHKRSIVYVTPHRTRNVYYR